MDRPRIAVWLGRVLGCLIQAVRGSQGYVSTELTHFVGAKARADEDRYQLLRTILSTGRLGTAFGASVGWMVSHSELPSSNNMFRPTIVCFCDIPLEHLAIHMKKYGSSWNRVGDLGRFGLWQHGQSLGST